MEAILQQLEEMIVFVEASVPANPHAPENEKLERRYASILTAYFRALAKAFPYGELAALFKKYANIESLSHIKESDPISDIKNILSPILSAFRVKLVKDIAARYVSVYLVGQSEMVSWGQTKLGLPKFYEGPPIRQAISYAERHCAQLVTAMDEESKNLISQAVADAVKNKRGVDGLARSIRDKFEDMSRDRAQMIARTETADALEQGFMDTAHGMGVTGKEWISHDPCEICAENSDIGPIGIDEEFPSGHTRPPAHPNCLLPGNFVMPLGMVAMTRAYYSGKAIEIHTRCGNSLTITVNHPILTPFGFIAAERLNKGDYIISSRDSKGMASSINPDYNNVPAIVEEIWESLIFAAGMPVGSMEVAPVDFHGDARFFDGDVDIVFTDRFLKCDSGDTPFIKHIGHEEFNLGDSEPLDFSSLRSLLKLGQRNMSPSDSFMGSCGSGRTFCGCHQGHRGTVSLAYTPRIDTSLKQPAADYSPVYPSLACQFLHRFASFITADEIVKIRDFDFSGHVYNLQSIEQLYIGNNIIVKNCRCALAPVMLPGSSEQRR